jgi:hypothetical protein
MSRFRDDEMVSGKLVNQQDDLIKDLERQLEEYMEIIKAVAHIGIDWGYGKFELKQDHIDKARKLYEAHEQLKEQG